MARLGGMMAALASGGEAQPNYPNFKNVMMVTGEVKVPKRVLPVYGFDGKELWPSEVGLQLGEDHDEDQQLTTGEPIPATFNWKDNTKEHIEGGRFVEAKRKMVLSPIKGNKRIPEFRRRI